MLSPRFLMKKARIGFLFVNCYCCKIMICRSTSIFSSVWNYLTRNKLKVVLVLLMIFISVPWKRFQTQVVKTLTKPPNEKIVIGLMACAGGMASTGRGKNETKAMMAASEEPLTLIKSVLISSKLSNVKRVEFHIFTDSWLLTSTMRKQIEGFSQVIKQYIKMTVHFYSAFNAVPPGYERDFVDNVRRCGYVRVFFPSNIPDTVKEILYLDTDVIITGNILQIWNSFKEKVVKNTKPGTPRKLAALVQNSEVFGTTYLDIYKDNFQWIPHVLPRGVNSGVMFMNLDAMREFDWIGEIIKIFKKRRSTLGGDQQLINILFHYNMDRLVMFPCQYNFQHLHCEKGLSCRNVTNDPGGIRIMHGAGGVFHKKGRSHIALFTAFKAFKLEHLSEVEKELFTPLKSFYSKQYAHDNLFGRGSCYGAVGKYLFRQLGT